MKEDKDAAFSVCSDCAATVHFKVLVCKQIALWLKAGSTLVQSAEEQAVFIVGHGLRSVPDDKDLSGFADCHLSASYAASGDDAAGAAVYF